MSPQDFRRMVLAWELTTQGTSPAGRDEEHPAPNDHDRPPQECPGSPAIDQGTLDGSGSPGPSA